MLAQAGQRQQTLHQLLKDKLPGRESLFTSEHLQTLSDKRLDNEGLLATATWEVLLQRPTLPYELIVELLRAFNQSSLRDSGTYLSSAMLLAVTLVPGLGS